MVVALAMMMVGGGSSGEVMAGSGYIMVVVCGHSGGKGDDCMW